MPLFQAGYRFAELTGATPESVIVRFFGIFFLFFQAAFVWGNLISSWGNLDFTAGQLV